MPLTMATNLKRAAVVAEARNQGAGGDFTGDAAVLNVKLSASTEALREAWLEEKARLTELQTRFAALSPYPSLPLYAEILQRGSLASVPVGPLWFPRTARWTGIGTLAGLTIALALAAFRRRPGNAGPADFPATPLVPGEY